MSAGEQWHNFPWHNLPFPWASSALPMPAFTSALCALLPPRYSYHVPGSNGWQKEFGPLDDKAFDCSPRAASLSTFHFAPCVMEMRASPLRCTRRVRQVQDSRAERGLAATRETTGTSSKIYPRSLPCSRTGMHGTCLVFHFLGIESQKGPTVSP